MEWQFGIMQMTLLKLFLFFFFLLWEMSIMSRKVPNTFLFDESITIAHLFHPAVLQSESN